MKQLVQILAIAALGHYSLAQQLPPIFENTPKKLVPATTLASFPQKTFLENILLLPDGSLLVNSHYEGIVYKINTAGQKEKFAAVNGKVTGIAAYGKDKFILSGNDENDKAEVYLLNSNGTIGKLMDLPQGQFLNGITHLRGDEFLIADSYKGCIWKINVSTKTAIDWLTDDLLKRASDQNPTPGANGIKVFRNRVYVSNTQKKQVLRAKITNGIPGKLEVYAENVNVDDFDFDAAGNLYGTTHIYNRVIKISPTKQVTVIAEQPQGASGSTACTLKKTPTGYTLYVSTNGGMSLPPPTGIEASKILALAIQ